MITSPSRRNLSLTRRSFLIATVGAIVESGRVDISWSEPQKQNDATHESKFSNQFAIGRCLIEVEHQLGILSKNDLLTVAYQKGAELSVTRAAIPVSSASSLLVSQRNGSLLALQSFSSAQSRSTSRTNEKTISSIIDFPKRAVVIRCIVIGRNTRSVYPPSPTAGSSTRAYRIQPSPTPQSVTLSGFANG